jgi:CRISPR/Cas system-associated exonuclease Cas4 (RecB family)
MKKEMIKFVSENFEVIKAQFLKDELKILDDCFGDDIDEFNMLAEILFEQMEVFTTEGLIDVINERSIGVDLDSDEVIELFNMIKAIKEVAN